MINRPIRVTLLLTCGLLVSCTSTTTPTSPDTAVQSAGPQFTLYGGVWHGEYTVPNCAGRQCTGGTLLAPFILRLAQDGLALRGNFEAAGAVIDVTGTINTDGEIVLSGYSPPVSTLDYVGAATLRVFRARLEPLKGLVGHLELTLEPTAETARGPIRTYTSEIVSGRRTAADLPSSFTGMWAGSFVARSCVPMCLPPHPSEVGEFELLLHQSGNDVSGTFRRGVGLFGETTDVRGHVTADALNLESVAPGASSGLRVVRWGTRRDQFGRMTGAFSFAAKMGQRDIQWDVTLGAVTWHP
jgi:hypothetical protein